VNEIGDLIRRIRLGEDSSLEFKSIVVAGKRIKEPSKRALFPSSPAVRRLPALGVCT